MLQMMQQMMNGGSEGQSGEGQGKGSKGQGEGQGGGGDGVGSASGKTGDPDKTAEDSERRVPKGSGNTGSTLPREFRKAMDAYNKGVSEKTKKP